MRRRGERQGREHRRGGRQTAHRIRTVPTVDASVETDLPCLFLLGLCAFFTLNTKPLVLHLPPYLHCDHFLSSPLFFFFFWSCANWEYISRVGNMTFTHSAFYFKVKTNKKWQISVCTQSCSLTNPQRSVPVLTDCLESIV